MLHPETDVPPATNYVTNMNIKESTENPVQNSDDESEKRFSIEAELVPRVQAFLDSDMRKSLNNAANALIMYGLIYVAELKPHTTPVIPTL